MDTILFAVLFLLAYLVLVHWLFSPKEQGLKLVEIATEISPETKNTETISQAIAIPEIVETSTQIQQDYSVDDTTEQVIETAKLPKLQVHKSEIFDSFETSQSLLETIVMPDTIPDTIAEQPENPKISETILQTPQYLEQAKNSELQQEQNAIHQAFMKTLEDFRKLTFLISQGKSASSENHLISK